MVLFGDVRVRIMFKIASRVIVTGAILLLVPHAAIAQDTPITGARLTIVEKSVGGVSVTIDNMRCAPLVAWEVGFVAPGNSTAYSVRSWSASLTGSYSAGNGPVLPGERRSLNIRSNFVEGSAVVIVLALFADDYCEGWPASVDT